MSVDITQLLRQIAAEEAAGRGQYLMAQEWRSMVEAMQTLGVQTTEELHDAELRQLRAELEAAIAAEDWEAVLEIGGSNSDIAYEMYKDRRIPTWYRWQVVTA
jgi:Mg-chelatase subunit ChlI